MARLESTIAKWINRFGAGDAEVTPAIDLKIG